MHHNRRILGGKLDEMLAEQTIRLRRNLQLSSRKAHWRPAGPYQARTPRKTELCIRSANVAFTDKQRRLLAEKRKAVGRKQLQQIASIASPDTILRWFRELVAKKYDDSKRRRPGPEGKSSEIKELVVQMARENRTWGYTRIVGAMANLGHKVGRNTVKPILQDAGVPPSPERRKGMPWKLFLSVHWDAIAAADFFSVEVMTLKGITRYMVLVVMELKTRRVEVAGIAHAPHGAWMMQVGRNVLDCEEGLLIDMVRGERHLRTVIRQYMEHFHEERNHQGLDNRLVAPCRPVSACEVVRREHLGGLLSHYHRGEAA